MRRTLLTVLSVGILVAWLVLSYAPAAWMPQIAWHASLVPWMGGLVGLLLVVFLALQIWVVWATDRALVANRDAMRDFRLGRLREVALTALPIAITALLAVASWQRVQALF